MNNEEGKLLDHEYDGIKELDNNLPLWWLWTFFGAIIFSFIYWLHYEIAEDGPTLDQELAMGMERIDQIRAQAQAKSAGGEELSAEDWVAMGKELYLVNCSSCHMQNGGGSVGPNLTDEYWIHGHSDEAITKVVAKGVLAKGMPPWEGILKPNDIKAVVAFVNTFKGKNVKGGKGPQGNKVE